MVHINQESNAYRKSRKCDGGNVARSRSNKTTSESNQFIHKRPEKTSGSSRDDVKKCKRSLCSPTNSISIPPMVSSQINIEDTIQMPQGSQAAAAAAMSFHPEVIPVSMNGSVSHTSFPLALLNKDGRIGIYLPEARKERIAKFHSKRQKRTWRKKIKYDCRKKLADSRPRVKGRFVKSMDDGE